MAHSIADIGGLIVPVAVVFSFILLVLLPEGPRND